MRPLDEFEVRSLLKKHSIRPSKDRGQSFLISQSIARNIVDASNLEPDDRVLEIGGGLGILTSLLAEKTESLYVIEIDSKLIRVLADRLKGFPHVRLIHGDALRVDLPAITKVISNLPYSVASAVTFRLLKEVDFELAILMYQKEFAQRLVARPGTSEYSRLSIDFQYLGVAEHLFDVGARDFYPVPRVDSSVLAVRKRKEGSFARDHDIFFWVIHGIYSYPNKQLRNALRIWLKRIGASNSLDALVERTRGCIDMSSRLRSIHLPDLILLSDVVLEMVRSGDLPSPRRDVI